MIREIFRHKWWNEYGNWDNARHMKAKKKKKGKEKKCNQPFSREALSHSMNKTGISSH